MQTVYIGNTLVNDVMLGSQRMDDVFTPVDGDTINFITATGITGTLVTAVNYLTTALKSNGLWDKLYAVYPLVGVTTSSLSYNLINTGSFQLQFTGSWTASADGIQGNGTTTAANTQFVPSSNGPSWAADASLAVYVGNNTNLGYDFGNSSTYLISRYFNDFAYFTLEPGEDLTAAVTSSVGFTLGTATNTNNYIYRGNTQLVTANKGGTSTIHRLFLGANFNPSAPSTPTDSTTRIYKYASIGKYLTPTDASNYYTIVQNFETILGRQV